MATKKKDIDPSDPTSWKDGTPIVTLHPEDQELDEVLSSLPQDQACIDIFRVNPLGGRPLYLETVQPSTFSLSYVLGRFGGGRYVASAKYLNGDKLKCPFEIEGEPIPVRRFGPGAGAEPITSPQMPRIQQMLQEPAPQNEFETVPNDTQGMFGVLVALIKDMKTSKSDMLKEMMMYKELFGAPQATGPQATADQMMQMIMKGIELAGKAGAGPEQNIWIELARELKEPLGKGLDAIQMALAAKGMQPKPAMGQVQPQPVPQPSTEPGEHMNVTIMKQLHAALPILINGAAKNADPAVYVDIILDQVPESLYPTLRDWMLRPDCLDMLANIEPGIRYQQEWWVGLRGGLIEALTEEVGNGLAAVQPTENPKPATGGPTAGGPAA